MADQKPCKAITHNNRTYNVFWEGNSNGLIWVTRIDGTEREACTKSNYNDVRANSCEHAIALAPQMLECIGL